MGGWDELTDDELMTALSEVVSPVQDAVAVRRRDAARGAFTWRSVDDELAELLHDSALDAGAAVRSSAAVPRSISFGRSGLGLELEVDGDDILGEVIAEGEAAALDAIVTVTVQRPDADDVVVTGDAVGFFRAPGLGHGVVRFVVERAGWTLTTPWVTL